MVGAEIDVAWRYSRGSIIRKWKVEMWVKVAPTHNRKRDGRAFQISNPIVELSSLFPTIITPWYRNALPVNSSLLALSINLRSNLVHNIIDILNGLFPPIQSVLIPPKSIYRLFASSISLVKSRSPCCRSHICALTVYHVNLKIPGRAIQPPTLSFRNLGFGVSSPLDHFDLNPPSRQLRSDLSVVRGH